MSEKSVTDETDAALSLNEYPLPEYLQKKLKVTSWKQVSIFMRGKNEMLKCFIIQSGQVVS